MKRRLFFVLPMLVSIGWLLGGCSSTGSPPPLSYDPNKPQTLLPGAEVEQAKSLAMGSAVTKGWQVIESSENRLVVERPLDNASAQSVTGEPVSTASVEVRSDFFKRQDGVNVVVGATLVANKGTEGERKIDFTDTYKDDLNQSLTSLRHAWDENRWRVTSSTPPIQPKQAVPEDEDTVGAAAAGGREQLAESGAEAAPGESFASPATTASAPEPAPTAAAAASTATVAPIEDRSDVTSPTPATTSAAPSYPPNDMLALDRETQTGVWSYYAEHYAKIRDCELSDKGAVLEDKTPEHEFYRVHCDDQKTFLVKCNAGTCRGMD